MLYVRQCAAVVFLRSVRFGAVQCSADFRIAFMRGFSQRACNTIYIAGLLSLCGVGQCVELASTLVVA